MSPDFKNYDFFRHGLDVSRETREKFSVYGALLLKWQKAINLVSNDSLEDMLSRHFLDSAQLVQYLPGKDIRLADMGSGAGFPGLVIAMMNIAEVHLIESDVRKATFLREVSRETGTKVFVHDDRVEDVKIDNLDVITARALAPLKDLFVMAKKLSTKDHPFTCLFMKGEKAEDELLKARKHWKFSVTSYQSITEQSGKILKINDLDVISHT